MQRSGVLVRGFRAAVATAVAGAVVFTAVPAGPASAVPDDDPDLQTRQVARAGPGTVVPAETLSRHMIDLGDSDASVADVAARVFRDNASFLRQAQNAPAGSLFGRPTATIAARELPDSYVLTRTTTLAVADPDALARSSVAFRRFRPDPGDAPSYSELPQAARDGLDRLWAESTSYPQGHPLRQAGEQGRQAFLEAVHEGAGELQVKDTFTVAKDVAGGGPANRHVLRNDGLVDYSASARTPDWLPIPILRLPLLPAPAAEPEEPPAPAPALVRNGRHDFSAKFLTGFTRGRSWEWQRRWNFPSGFFRLDLGASYGLGLRVPLTVTGSMTPTRIRRSAGVDSTDAVEFAARVQPIDADAAHYRAAGLDDNAEERGKIFDGKEFVLNAQTYYGLRLRALFMNIAYVPRTTFGVDLNRNWRPPFGAFHGTADGSPTFVIPAAETHTEFSPLPGLSGWAQFGVNINGTGRAMVTHQPVIDGERGASRRMTFTDATPQERVWQLPTLRPDVGEEERINYGFRLSDPRYVANLNLTPMLRAGVTAGYGSFSRSFTTDWISFPAARISLGNLSLGRHAGTDGVLQTQPGRKVFARTRGNAATDGEIPDVLALRARDGSYIRAGLSDGALLGPGSRQIGGWERFHVHVARLAADNPKFTLRSSQSQDYVRAGVSDRSLLAATSPRVGPDWEWFRRVELDGGREWALKSAHSRRFVVLGANGYLQATGRELGDAYRFRPVSLDNVRR